MKIDLLHSLKGGGFCFSKKKYGRCQQNEYCPKKHKAYPEKEFSLA